MPTDPDVHLVLVNSATHKTKLIGDWLAQHPRYHVHFTPTSASWINQVERWFGLSTERAIRRGVHCSVEELELDIRAFIAATNVDPKPFRWVKSADAILASVKRFCLQTLDAQIESPDLPETSDAGNQPLLKFCRAQRLWGEPFTGPWKRRWRAVISWCMLSA